MSSGPMCDQELCEPALGGGMLRSRMEFHDLTTGPVTLRIFVPCIVACPLQKDSSAGRFVRSNMHPHVFFVFVAKCSVEHFLAECPSMLPALRICLKLFSTQCGFLAALSSTTAWVNTQSAEVAGR